MLFNQFDNVLRVFIKIIENFAPEALINKIKITV